MRQGGGSSRVGRKSSVVWSSRRQAAGANFTCKDVRCDAMRCAGGEATRILEE